MPLRSHHLPGVTLGSKLRQDGLKDDKGSISEARVGSSPRSRTKGVLAGGHDKTSPHAGDSPDAPLWAPGEMSCCLQWDDGKRRGAAQGDDGIEIPLSQIKLGDNGESMNRRDALGVHRRGRPHMIRQVDVGQHHAEGG
jgi:hypothetical protein